jgi:hypothetical protein
MASGSLMDWPDELQLSVLNHLSSHDLTRLSLVNNGFRRLAQPCLYAGIVLTWSRDQTPPLALLLRALFERHQLASHVRRLELLGTGFASNVNLAAVEPPPLPVSALPAALAAAHIRATGVSEADQWVQELQAGACDALVALLLSMLPNLTRLQLDSNFTIESSRIGEVFRCAVQGTQERQQQQFRLAFLRHVTFARRTHEWRHRGVNNAADVLPLFSLPAIESLSVSVDNPVSWPFTLADSPLLTSLTLFRLRETRLSFLLPSLKSLKRLHWHCYYHESLDTYASSHVIDLDAVAEALHHVSETLTELVIEPESEPDYLRGEYEPPGRELKGSLGGLAKMRRLQRLEIPWAFLMGISPDSALTTDVRLHEVLPPSLEILNLTDGLLDYELWDWEDDVFVHGIKAALGSQEATSSLLGLRSMALPITSHDTDGDSICNELDEMGSQFGIIFRSYY